MAPLLPDHTARDLADLRLQVSALVTTTQDTALPSLLARVRGTVRNAALLVAAALIISSLVKVWGDARVRRFEQRLERLESRDTNQR